MAACRRPRSAGSEAQRQNSRAFEERNRKSGGRTPTTSRVESVHADRAADHPGIAAEPLPPDAIGQDGDAAGFVGGFLLDECAPQRGPGAERREELRRDRASPAHVRSTRARPTSARAFAVERHRAERGDRAPALVIVRHRRPVVRHAGLRIRVEDAHQSVGAGERQRPQQHGVDDGEDRQVGAEAERDRQPGRSR